MRPAGMPANGSSTRGCLGWGQQWQSAYLEFLKGGCPVWISFVAICHLPRYFTAYYQLFNKPPYFSCTESPKKICASRKTCADFLFWVETSVWDLDLPRSEIIWSQWSGSKIINFWSGSGSPPFSHRSMTFLQCCGSGSGSERIRNFWPDPDTIRIRN